jgi:hypothetical protein
MMTNRLAAAVEQVSGEQNLLHLSTSENLDRALELALTANKQAIATELRLLRSNAAVAIAAMWIGVVLLATGVVLVYLGKTNVGIASSTMGLVSEVIPMLIFRRLDVSRREIRRRLPSYSSLYAVLVALEVSDAGTRAEVLEALKGVPDETRQRS